MTQEQITDWNDFTLDKYFRPLNSSVSKIDFTESLFKEAVLEISKKLNIEYSNSNLSLESKLYDLLEFSGILEKKRRDHIERTPQNIIPYLRNQILNIVSKLNKGNDDYQAITISNQLFLRGYNVYSNEGNVKLNSIYLFPFYEPFESYKKFLKGEIGNYYLCNSEFLLELIEGVTIAIFLPELLKELKEISFVEFKNTINEIENRYITFHIDKGFINTNSALIHDIPGRTKKENNIKINPIELTEAVNNATVPKMKWLGTANELAAILMKLQDFGFLKLPDTNTQKAKLILEIFNINEGKGISQRTLEGYFGNDKIEFTPKEFVITYSKNYMKD
jgi:hypothetical protein